MSKKNKEIKVVTEDGANEEIVYMNFEPAPAPVQTPRVLFRVKAINDVALRQYASLDAKFIQGKMDKRKVYDVLSVVESAPIQMYKLDNGYYVIGDGNLLKI